MQEIFPFIPYTQRTAHLKMAILVGRYQLMWHPWAQLFTLPIARSRPLIVVWCMP